MADDCAKNPSELDKSLRLQNIKNLFKNGPVISYVNDTKGSFFTIESSPEKFSISFYTSGLFDLYGVRRDGDLTFCDNGESIIMIGLKRRQKLTILENQLIIDKGGPRFTFHSGEMPDPLKKLHGVDSKEPASQD